jgi:thymidylate synthase (FAD)
MTSEANILGEGMGTVELLDVLGGDLANVNGARASFNTRKEKFDGQDERLLNRLAEQVEQTPLRHTYVQLYIEAPEFVARQWYKHIVGCEYAFKDLPWSEFSQRYKEVPPKFFIPKFFRAQSDTNKQASGSALEGAAQGYSKCLYADSLITAVKAYNELLAQGVAREQARLVLPLSTFTSWVWTASLQAIVHFCALRDEAGAQQEIQHYAKAVRAIVEPLAPVSFAALLKQHPLTLKRANS